MSDQVQTFITQYAPVAAQVGQQIGVAPDVLLGHWGLETGWGQHVVPGTNNLGNMKGAGVAAVDNQTGSNDQYQQFASPDAFGSAFTNMIAKGYPQVAGTGENAAAYAQGLVKGGYAEDPHYVGKVTGAIDTVRKFGNMLASAISGTANADELTPAQRVAQQQPQADAFSAAFGAPQAHTAPQGDAFSAAFEAPATQGNSPAAASASTSSASSKPVVPDTGESLDLAAGGGNPDAISQMGEIASGAAHGIGNLLHGAAQLVEHGVKSAANYVAPNSSVTGAINRTVASDDQALAARQQQFDQSASPGEQASSTLAPFFVPMGGLGRVGEAVEGAARAVPVVPNMLAKALGSGAVGATVGAAQPVTNVQPQPGNLSDMTSGQGSADDFWRQKLGQMGAGAAVGGALPLAVGAGKYGYDLLRAATDPFTEAGQSNIASNIAQRVAQGGPTTGDASQIIAGSQPTLAQATNNAGLAALERAAQAKDPNTFAELGKANNDARNSLLDALTGDQTSLQQAAAARDQAALPKLNQAFANAGDANPVYVDRAINRILNSPSGQRDAVVNALAPIQEKLTVDNPLSDRLNGAFAPIDALSQKTGRMSSADFDLLQSARTMVNSARRGYTDLDTLTQNLSQMQPSSTRVQGALNQALTSLQSGETKYQTDPAQLYGIRKSITDALTNVAGRDNSASQLAARELTVVKNGLDNAIEKAAPGYKDYLQTYSDLSKPVNAQQYLQGMNLTDANGNPTLAKVQRGLDNIQSDQAAKGVNNAKSLTDDQVSALMALRDDLKRAGNSAAGKGIGSNTFQNFATNNLMQTMLPGRIGQMAGKVPLDAVGAGAGWLAGGPMGAMIGGGTGRALGGLYRAQDEAIQNKLVALLTNPQSGLAAINGVPRSVFARQLLQNPLAQRLIGNSSVPFTFGVTRALTEPSNKGNQ